LLDLLYGQAVATRRRWFERHPHFRRRLQRPVISIGNLSVGGTGKTPLVALITQWLMDLGERPAILSRGYGRAERCDGVVVVSDGNRVLADVNRAGDEPLMLARKIAGALVLVADDRYLAGVLAERRLDATVHVLDDGFQHVQLARDLDILMTMPGEVTAGRVLPFGRLRERPDAAARAHVVVVLDTDAAGARTEAWALGVSQAVGARRRLQPAAGRDFSPVMSGGRDMSEGRDFSPAVLQPAEKAVAVAGIANPQQFFHLLREAGYDITQTLAFADHHVYGRADLARVTAALRDARADVVVTTEKDLVRWESLAPLPFQCVGVPLTLDIDGWTTLTASVEQALVRAREVA
jgi:tetraacyldisaccharide 4'-kinase